VLNLSLSLAHKEEEAPLVPREVMSTAADGAPGSPAGRTDLLLRFFDSEFFNEWIAVQCVPIHRPPFHLEDALGLCGVLRVLTTAHAMAP
jgi:hypothetical protein